MLRLFILTHRTHSGRGLHRLLRTACQITGSALLSIEINGSGSSSPGIFCPGQSPVWGFVEKCGFGIIGLERGKSAGISTGKRKEMRSAASLIRRNYVNIKKCWNVEQDGKNQQFLPHL